jgi:hypothetical protein
MDERVSELLAFAVTEGLTLPYPPAMIVRLEDAGHVVDLATGAVLLGEGNRPYRWQWTPAGEAWAHLVREGLVGLEESEGWGTPRVDG